jgi:hypothetical protein
VVSSWKDALTSNVLNKGIAQHIEVPVNGCFKDVRKIKLADSEPTFRPLGVLGRLCAVWPFHGAIFSGMTRRIAATKALLPPK